MTTQEIFFFFMIHNWLGIGILNNAEHLITQLSAVLLCM